MKVGTSDPVALPAKPPRKPRTKVTPALEAEFIRLAGQGKSGADIARLTGVNANTVSRYLQVPAAATRIATSLAKIAVDKMAIRERMKEKVIARAEASVDRAFDLADKTITNEDAKGFALTMTGIEKLDKVSGTAVGEGTRVIHEGLPHQPPQVELKVLIQQVLGAARA